MRTTPQSVVQFIAEYLDDDLSNDDLPPGVEQSAGETTGRGRVGDVGQAKERIKSLPVNTQLGIELGDQESLRALEMQDPEDADRARYLHQTLRPPDAPPSQAAPPRLESYLRLLEAADEAVADAQIPPWLTELVGEVAAAFSANPPDPDTSAKALGLPAATGDEATDVSRLVDAAQANPDQASTILAAGAMDLCQQYGVQLPMAEGLLREVGGAGLMDKVLGNDPNAWQKRLRDEVKSGGTDYQKQLVAAADTGAAEKDDQKLYAYAALMVLAVGTMGAGMEVGDISRTIAELLLAAGMLGGPMHIVGREFGGPLVRKIRALLRNMRGKDESHRPMGRERSSTHSFANADYQGEHQHPAQRET